MPRKKVEGEADSQAPRYFSSGSEREARSRMPRPHHYLFAHRLVPAMFFSNPARFMETLETGGEGLLYFLWDRIRQDMSGAERLSPEGLRSEFIKLEEGVQVGVILLPKPTNQAEAFMTAAVYRAEGKGKVEIQRYFTLEKSILLSGASETVLCEWSGLDQHLNYGAGTKPEVDAFVKAIQEKL